MVQNRKRLHACDHDARGDAMQRDVTTDGCRVPNACNANFSVLSTVFLNEENFMNDVDDADDNADDEEVPLARSHTHTHTHTHTQTHTHTHTHICA